MTQEYSVLMSIYNKDKPEWLALALDSMLMQTPPPAEFVVIVDGPVSEELNLVLESAATAHPGVFRVHRLAANGGLGQALAVGLPLCTCEWVARMDADDIACADRMEKQLAYLHAHPETDILGGAIDEFIDAPDHAVTRRVPPLTHELILAFAKSRNPFNHMTVMLRREKALDAGGYRTYLRLEDYDLWLRMFRAGAKGANLADTLVFARSGKDAHARRQGAKNTRALIRFYGEMRAAGDIGLARYLYNILCGVSLYMMPAWLRARMYKLLREKA